MNKIAMLLTAALIAGVVTVKITDVSERPDSEPIEGNSEDQRVEGCMVRYQRFKAVLAGSMDALEKNELTLKEAAVRVVAAAHADNSMYLRQLTGEEPGRTDMERVAHNLVGHLGFIQQIKPFPRERMRALETELASWK